MTTTDARKRRHERDMADAHATARARDAGYTTHFAVGNGWLANNLTGEFTRLDQETDTMTDHRAAAESLLNGDLEDHADASTLTSAAAHALLAIHDTLRDIAGNSAEQYAMLTEIRDRLPERAEATLDWLDEPVPVPRPDPAPDVDPDEAWARERWAESANIASWSALHPETQRVLVDFARSARTESAPADVDPDEACPTCEGPTSRETVGMVCQTCGKDYAADVSDPHGYWQGLVTFWRNSEFEQTQRADRAEGLHKALREDVVAYRQGDLSGPSEILNRDTVRAES